MDDPLSVASAAETIGRSKRQRAKSKVPAPFSRRLRAFAFDPLLSSQLETLRINEVTVPVVWEDCLLPGPVGEYLEVVDFDPAGNCFYDPVDLNDPHLLATDGLTPSEGNPQFHQQMVYAVAMTTIRHFEMALGRKALWSPRSAEGDSRFVQRLRIYPHALREANAYYSPDKKSLLFGYFPATAEAPGRNLKGGIVFACLSHDIVAHETTHALLDGVHERFIEPSNIDVLAFHEAFADIVALFQHFSYPDVLKAQIAKTRGDLSSQNLLGQLAQQFGEATGNNGALRDALGRFNKATGRWEPLTPDETALESAVEPHVRGAILVAAVFDAFIAIYNNRVADLQRMARTETDKRSGGELHPDLVGRLSDEAAKAATHVLRMCIRAIDYCPPSDLTFGEYLRALVTADLELVRDDDLGYRISTIEAFRRRGIYPRNVRSLAVESLCWDRADEVDGANSFRLFDAHKKQLLDRLNKWNLSADRRQIYNYTREIRKSLHTWFAQSRDAGDPAMLEALTGLALSRDAPWTIERGADGMPKFEVHAARPARRVGPDGQLNQSLVVELTQRRDGYYDIQRQQQADRGELPAATAPDFLFRGGSTLIFDLETAEPRFCIRKSICADDRLDRQRQFMRRAGGTAFHICHGSQSGHLEPFALLHRRAAWEAYG